MRYASNGGVSIAYQVLGDGPRDLLFVCGTMSHLELWWSDPQATAMLERLASFSRLIIFDKPGTGLSDPIPAAPTLDQRTADLVSVLDAVGSERATLIGYSEGGLPAIVLAATQPERVDALVLLDAAVAMEWHPDLDVPASLYERVWAIFDEACDRWGEGVLTSAMSPTMRDDPRRRDLLPVIERTCMSPGMARSVLQGYRGLDARGAAATVHVPTLVLHCADDELVPAAVGRDAARRIPGATYVELAGADHFVWLHNSEAVPAAIERFLTGRSSIVRDDDRILTTICFTDIVDSTATLAAMGDARWRAILADHDRRMDELLGQLNGKAVKHTGDGRLVHFERPARAVRFAAAMAEEAKASGIELRAGIHTGECEVVGDDLIGVAVNVAARICSAAAPGQVLVSSTVRDLVVGSGLRLVPVGAHDLKGLADRWELHRYDCDDPGPLTHRGYETDVRNPA